VEDCAGLSTVGTHLGLAASPNETSAGGWFDPAYGPDRSFLADYASRAPSDIRADVLRLRDFLDRYATAAQAAGVESGTLGTQDQLDKIKAAMHLSSAEQDGLRTSIQVIASWTVNGCGNGGSSGGLTTASGGQAVSAKDCRALGNVVSDLRVGVHADELINPSQDISPSNYVADRDFLDLYASRAPGTVRADVLHLRLFIDRYSAAAQAAGVKPGTVPTFNQLRKVIPGLGLGSVEQDQVPTSIRALKSWTGNRCSGPLPTAGTGTASTRTATIQAATTEASPTVAAPSGAQTTSSADDCVALGNVVTDLVLFDSAGTGFDYPADRKFLDGYADRAPGAIADSVRRLRDIVDRLAEAAQGVGLEPNKDVLPDQADKIKKVFHYSSIEQAANARAIQTLQIWHDNGCS
jgi:hypothetical protein